MSVSRSLPDRLTLLNAALVLLLAAAAWIGVVIQSTSMTDMGGAVTSGAAADGAMDDMGTDATAMEGADASTDGAMADMGEASMEDAAPVQRQEVADFAGLVAFVVAWAVMMAAMMLPSALPMILLYRTVARGQAARGKTFVPTWVFVAGYLLVWAVFGILVYLASRLVALAIANSMTVAAWAPYGVAAVLLAAGAYQFTPLKRVCLRACQSPLGFLMSHWKAGPNGALRMGVEHGLYCVGCCWGLMAVLVVAGAMGLPWVLLIAAVVAAEKLLPRGQWAARITGLLLLGVGVWVALRPDAAMMLRG